MDISKLASLAPLVHAGPAPLFATVSGAHLYGFASRDSDIDLRGAFVLPLKAVLRLRDPEETITITQQHNGLDVDWVAHDVLKFKKCAICDPEGFRLEHGWD